MIHYLHHRAIIYWCHQFFLMSFLVLQFNILYEHVPCCEVIRYRRQNWETVWRETYSAHRILTTLQCTKHIINAVTFNNLYTRVSLDNDQLDAHLLYFAIRPLQSSTCFEHYMLIIRRLNCTDAASGVILSVGGCPVHSLRQNSQKGAPDGHYLRGWYQMLHRCNLASWWWAYNAWNM